MSEHVLKAILEEERLAAQSLREAYDEANEVIKNAESAARERERKAAVERRGAYQRVLEEYRARAEQEIGEQAGEAAGKAYDALAPARARLEQAAEAILKEVLDGHR
ncbi:MAG TPA: hypothetical protein VLA21_06615 [Candidatus Limnocylindria bacterium]|nr:hypothetical protein [Candidatus Limnocylindria bacterium]